jgi:plasmid stabilization system protein ParE
MAGVVWLSGALQDLKRLDSFLRENSPEAANAALLSIKEATKVLESMPEIGRPLRVRLGTREIYAKYGASAYAIRYRVVNGDPAIIHIWHHKEKRPRR